MQQMEPITSQVPYMTAIGNHERDWPGTGTAHAEAYDSGEARGHTTATDLHCQGCELKQLMGRRPLSSH